ncbi:MAG: preprotein translocase subunit SecY [Clostridiales bacterium GWF2_38_85]|nr:MAG: preprotein translocase subunit SecY [Clostridiales bacterium GWF2_38_85]HBL84927.1 preprotein translocase subunit SecY [Clostridiales bacterium]
MFQTFKNAWKVPDLKAKLMFTLIIILLYRLGAVIPVPFVDSEALAALFGSSSGGSDLFSYFNILSGNAFSQATLFALSVSPYITASIVMQLLTIAIEPLERLQKSGPEGQKKIAQITRFVTIAIGAFMAIGYYVTLSRGTEDGPILLNVSWFTALVIILCFIAGSAIIMWLAEKINDNGIGNGISILLFANIVSRGPNMALSAFTMIKNDMLSIITVVIIIAVMALSIYFIVFMTNSERRLPVQYAKKQVGRKIYGGMNTHLPIKLNMSGVMPIIFAQSIVALPATLGLIFPTNSDGFWKNFLNLFSSSSALYPILTFVLIIAFAYFYLTISFNPIEVANNLQKNGGTILGYRPGKPTSDYITKVLNRVTLIGALFLGIVAVFPFLIRIFDRNMAGFVFGGTSILIVVGVVLETTREIESQMTMRHYKGFLE